MLLSNSYSKLGSLMIEKILVPLKNGLAPWELDTWRNMRKVSSEAASISCIYFQQKKISKNQEIRNWITVLQYHKKKPQKTNKQKSPTELQKPLRACTYRYKFNNCQASSQNKKEDILIYFKY